MCEHLNVWEIRFIHKIVPIKYMPNLFSRIVLLKGFVFRQR